MSGYRDMYRAWPLASITVTRRTFRNILVDMVRCYWCSISSVSLHSLNTSCFLLWDLAREIFGDAEHAALGASYTARKRRPPAGSEVGVVFPEDNKSGRYLPFSSFHAPCVFRTNTCSITHSAKCSTTSERT